MKKVFSLKTCFTCNRIIKELGGLDDFEKQNIKIDLLSPTQLIELKEMAGSYESLFSRRSQQFRTLGLHEMTLSEEDYKSLILKEYTFLKRPVIIIGEQIFIGNSKVIVDDVKKALLHI